MIKIKVHDRCADAIYVCDCGKIMRVPNSYARITRWCAKCDKMIPQLRRLTSKKKFARYYKLRWHLGEGRECYM